ncbi:TetR/AcrR family transcriptional regulator [Streptomyces sp. CBMA29]|uniref:TetR/AcrR family transcriptional regulator n=1 Tax=Streptomyces sp. CBMA29 TaxID=1896314 RepID=UPI001661B7F0|nr:TetR/AcrR family transcriptional regulator [Streptomyces sp. CBMA29]MBD0735811.1 TetR family transcriptional regulator [Streptomyces sp. CBMA29]
MTEEGGPRQRGEQRRGEELRRHILFMAKDVFLEAGYERASMDAVAARAGTSKRSLYAHFENKDKLFLAVLGLVRELYLGKLRTPDAYSADPAEAVALFCARFLQLMTWETQVRTCRLSIAAAERLPASSRAYFDAMFATTQERLAAYLVEHYDTTAADALAQDLLARTVLPRVFRTLLNVEDATKGMPQDDALADHVDLPGIRRVVAGALPVPE